MKKNKLFLLVAIFAAAFLILAACGNGDATETETEPTGDMPMLDPVTDADTDHVPASDLSGTMSFNWWGNDDRHAATIEVIHLFMELHEGVTINYEYGAWDGWQARITSDLMANQEADLMQVNFNWLALFSPDGDTFMDLEDPALAALNLNNWEASDIDMMRRNGVVQGVPVGMTARVPFMRADIYEAAGLQISEINTWSDLIDAGNAIQSYHGNDVFALSPLGQQSLAYMVFSYIEQFTGRPFVDENFTFNYTLEELERGFGLVQDFLDNGVIPDGSFDSDPINASNPLWIAGNYGGVSEWDSSINAWIGNLEEGADVIEIRPHFTYENALNSGWMSRPSMAFAISRNTENPELVSAFLNFMLTDERAIEIIGTDRGVPVNTVGRAHFDQLPLANDLVVQANAIHATAATTTMDPVFENPVVRLVYELQLMEIFHRTTTPEEAAYVVYTTIQDVIDAEMR